MKLKLHWQILIGLVTGTLFGIFAAWNQWSDFTQGQYHQPWATCC